METGIKLSDLKSYLTDEKLNVTIYDCVDTHNPYYIVDMDINNLSYDVKVSWDEILEYMAFQYGVVANKIDGEATLCIPEYNDEGDIIFCTPCYEYFNNFKYEILEELINKVITK